MHTLEILVRMCRRQEDGVGFSSGFVLISSWGSAWVMILERTAHTKWSLGYLETGGSLMKVKNNRELDQFYLRASYTRSYSHFSRTNFGDILFLEVALQNWFVAYRLFHVKPFGRTIISGLHSYWSTHYLSIKERNWKETWVAWKGRVRTHIFLEFLKKYSLLHTLQVLFRMCRRQEDEVGFSSGLCWYLLGIE